MQMSNFRNKLISFMYGRYGMDALYGALLTVSVVLAVINIFADSWILSTVGTVVLVYAIFRCFSKNHAARRKENEVWLKIWTPVGKWFGGLIMRLRDIRTRRYRRCPSCKATLRLPIKRGKHYVKCPKCRAEFQVRIVL
ncbi:MAG: hypothetical protein IJY28_04750 [Clostridia bacterium]|nr:hypothetical protein [Clostridia bacterium]